MTNSLLKPYVLFIVLLPLAACGQEREWTSRQGKFKIEATLLDFSDGKVSLRRSDNGKTIQVDITKLSRVDREFVASLYGSKTNSKSQPANESNPATEVEAPSNEIIAAPKVLNVSPDKMKTPDPEENGSLQAGNFNPAESPSERPNKEQGPSPSMGKTSGQAIWEPTFINGKQDHSMQLEITDRGEVSAEAMEYGMLAISSMADESGQKISIKESDFAFDDLTKTFKKVDRNDKFFQKHPKNGIRLTIDIDADESVKRLTDVRGSFRVRSGGTQKRKEIAVSANSTGSIDIAEGLKANILIEGAELRFELSGDHSKIFDVEALTKAGEKHPKLNGGGEGGGGNLYQYFFSFDGNVPDDVVLSVLTISGMEETEIKFEIPSVKIPAKPKNSF